MGKETFYGDALSQFKIFLVETNIFHSRIGREWCIPLPGVSDVFFSANCWFGVPAAQYHPP